MKLRIKFAKYGSMKFIGHLDVMRYFQKAIRRAQIPIEYSTGFSPHQKMSFAAPLGVGHETRGDYFDIEVSSITNVDDMLHRFNKQMSPGCEILDIVLLPDTCQGAMASVAAADYLIHFRDDYNVPFLINEAVERFKNAKEVIVTKQTKKSEISLDLKPSVYKIETHDNSLFMQVDASSAGNIKPDLVLSALYSFYEANITPFSYIIERLETYGKDNDDILIPLSAFGEHF